MDTLVSRFRVFSMFSLILDALLERRWMCRGPVLGLFNFFFCSYAVKASVFVVDSCVSLSLRWGYKSDFSSVIG